MGEGSSAEWTLIPEEVEIDFLILADAANESNGKFSILGGGFNLHHAKAYPVVFRFSTILGILIPRASIDDKFVATLNYVGPTGRSLGEATAEFQAIPTNGGKLVPDRAILILTNELPIEGSGVYTVVASIGTSTKRTWFESLPTSVDSPAERELK